jgi:hypothetical protein
VSSFGSFLVVSNRLWRIRHEYITYELGDRYDHLCVVLSLPALDVVEFGSA